MCKYYFNQRDWHMNQYCNLESELDLNANMTADTFADYTAKYKTKSAPVAVVTDFVEILEVYGTCQIYLFAINGGTLKNGIIYFNASVDVSTKACTRIEFSPFGIVIPSAQNAVAVNNIIITGVVNITTKTGQTLQLSNAFSYVLGTSAVSGVKSNLKINVNGTEQANVYGSFDNNVTVENATDTDLGGLTEFTTQGGITVKIKAETFGTDYDALDFVQLAYQGMGAFTKMFVRKSAEANVFAFNTEVLQEQPTGLDQELLVAVGNTETIAFTNAGFTVCSPYDGQYDVTRKTCLQSPETCGDKWSIEDRICLKTDQNCPSAYYKKEEGKKCYSSIDISQGQTFDQNNEIVTCQTNQKAFENNTCQTATDCPSGFILFGTQGCVLECPEGNEQTQDGCKIPSSTNDCTGTTQKFIVSRANNPARCAGECPDEYYEVNNECKVKCDGETIYNPKAKTCGNSCPEKYLKQEQYCVQQCSSCHVKVTTECAKINTSAEQCPEGLFADVPMSMCVPCGVLTKAYWDRLGTNYGKSKCVDTCSYYNFSQYEQSKRPAQLLDKNRMFFCEEIKTEKCRVYDIQDSKKVCKDRCYDLSKFLSNETIPECIQSCEEKEVSYRKYTVSSVDKYEYVCDRTCDYYKTETITAFQSNPSVRNCSQCDEENYYRHINKDCDTQPCNKTKDGNSVFILKPENEDSFKCINYEPANQQCPFVLIKEAKRECTVPCLTYCEKTEEFQSSVTYNQCVNTSETLDIHDCPAETPAYRFFSKQGDSYKCVADCAPKMFEVDSAKNNQSICTDECITYYLDEVIGDDYKNCLDKDAPNINKCKEIKDAQQAPKYRYLEPDGSMYKCVNTCANKYVDINETCADTCTSAYYRASDPEKICLSKCNQTNETVVRGLENPRQCLAFSACTDNQKFLKRGATEADDNECVETCADTLFFYNEHQQSETEKYYTCETSCANKKAEKQPLFGKEDAHKCMERCEKAQRLVENTDYTLCLDACDQKSEFLISKDSQDCVKECGTGVTYYYYNQTDNICLKDNTCSEEPYKREVSNQIKGYTECKTYCNDNSYLYKKDCDVTEDLINAQCCKPTCGEFGDSPIYYKNEKLCMKKCVKDDNTSMYAYRSNASNGKAGQCTEMCESQFYVVDGEGTDVQTKFCDECQDGYHVQPEDHQTVLCSNKCPTEKPYAYPHNQTNNKGLCVAKCEPEEFEDTNTVDSEQSLFCATCKTYYVTRGSQKQCYNECPEDFPLRNDNGKECLTVCPTDRFRKDDLCYNKCPDPTFTNRQNKSCDASCTVYDLSQKFCLSACNEKKLVFKEKTICLQFTDEQQCNNTIDLTLTLDSGSNITALTVSCRSTNTPCQSMQYDIMCVNEQQKSCTDIDDLMSQLQYKKNLTYNDSKVCVERCPSGYTYENKTCTIACSPFFQEPDGIKTCRNCKDDEIQIDNSNAKQCIKNCSSTAPYYDDGTKQCKSTCSVFYSEDKATNTGFCLAACPEKLYETRSDGRQFCITTCTDPRIRVTSKTHAGHQECMDGCPQTAPYYLADAFECAAECTTQKPYYDPAKRACAASCTSATPYYPDPNGANISCTDCSSGVIFENEGMKQCLASCPAGYSAINGVCEATASNKGAASWWVWAAVAAGVLLLVIIAAVLAVYFKRRNALVPKGANSTGGTSYYSRAVHRRVQGSQARGRQQAERPINVSQASAPHQRDRSVRSGISNRSAAVSGYRTNKSSGASRQDSITSLTSSRKSHGSLVDISRGGYTGSNSTQGIQRGAVQQTRNRLE